MVKIVDVRNSKERDGLFLLFGARLVHLLNHLKRQDDVADLAALTVPDQFHFALVLEEQETKLVRQRFVRLQKTDDLLLFLFSQSWHGVFLLFVPLQPRVRLRGAMKI